jgi:non-canonical purine NTP pyrophosphatase (RdgB/HAM1 family)
MIKLLTSNPNKYNDFQKELEFLQLNLTIIDENLPEIQTESIEENIIYKAVEAEKKYKEPVFVDDSALFTEQYKSFPGVNTKLILKQLGKNGLQKLFQDSNAKAKMVTVLGISINGEVFTYIGEVKGYLDFTKKINNPKMILSDIFIPIDKNKNIFHHRLNALTELKKDILNIHIKYDLLTNKTFENQFCTEKQECPFCIEFEDINKSLFYSMTDYKIKNRILYEDNDFIVLIPLGQFVEGGLLLLTKEHIHSFAHLDKEKYALLNNLVERIKSVIHEVFGVVPIIFEHSSSINRSKGKCCVDHAHFNIFPVDIDITEYITDRISSLIVDINELSKLKFYDNGYLYVDSVKNGKLIFDGKNVPTQLIRQHLTHRLGCQDRWHWKDYLGIEEIKQTLSKLSGKIL